MPKVSYFLRTDSKITELKKLNHGLIGICTKMHGAKFFLYDASNSPVDIFHEYLNSTTSNVAFSQNTEFLAFSIKSSIYVLHLPTKTVVKIIKTDNEVIDMLEFDLESKYIIAATRSGRVMQYRYDKSSMIARLYSFKTNNDKKYTPKNLSTVSSFAFCKNIMACGGDCGTIFTINLHSRANKRVYSNASSRINSICFLNSSHIASGDSKGNLYLNCVKDGKLIKKIQTGFTQVKQIVLMPNSNYLMIIGDANYVAIYDKNFKIIYSKYIEFNDIVNKVIVANENTLLVALNNQCIEKVVLSNSSEIISLIMENSLDKAYALVQQDYMLIETKEYKALEVVYDKVYSKAVQAIVSQNREKLLQIISIFKDVKSKKKDIHLLIKAFDNYPRFKTLYVEKKYAVAYNMSTTYPALTKTVEYEKMEKKWRNLFVSAQKQILSGRIYNAKSLLHDYLIVAEKRPVVKLILNHNSNFIKFLRAIDSKDFQKIHMIAKTNKFFTQIPIYKSIELEINKELEDVQNDIYNCNIDTANKKIAKLRGIDSIASKIITLNAECIAISKLQTAYKLNDFIKCYEILDKNSSLYNTRLGSFLQQHWLEIITKCEGFALNGNIKDIKLTLGGLIDLETRKDRIGDLFRISFYEKIKALMTEQTYKKAENIIYSYIDIFGQDNEIVSIMKLYERVSNTKLAITHRQGTRQTRDSWINSDIIMGS